MLSKERMLEIANWNYDESLFKKARWVNLDEAELLRDWVSVFKPHTVLESGTANGYSASWLASALEDEAKVYTFDPVDRPKIWDYFPDVASKVTFCNAKFSCLRDFVNLCENTKTLAAFIDGDHGYLPFMEDWQTVQPVLSDGDLVLFHDLRESKIIKGMKEITSAYPNSMLYVFNTKRVVGAMVYQKHYKAASTDVFKVIEQKLLPGWVLESQTLNTKVYSKE